MTPLEFLAQRNDDWLRMARSVSQWPNDSLQEAYIKLHKRFKDDMPTLLKMQKNQVEIYVWLTLKSCSAKIAQTINASQALPDNLELEAEEYQEDNQEEVLEKIQEEIESWHWYDTKLFDLHYFQGLAMREISRQTKISLSSIWHTIKTCRERITENLPNEILINEPEKIPFYQDSNNG